MLENTDKAVAGILDAIQQYSSQVSPEVMNTFTKVAQLHAVGNLIDDGFWLVGATIVGTFLIWAIRKMVTGDDLDDCVGVVIMSGIGALICCAIVVASVSSLSQPLNWVAAQDGKIALAVKVMDKIESATQCKKDK